MASVGFEPTISAGEWPQTYALDRAATGTGLLGDIIMKYFQGVGHEKLHVYEEILLIVGLDL